MHPTFTTQMIKYKPMALIVFSGVLYGMLGCFGTRILEENMAVSSMLFWRFFIAAIWMGGFALIKKQPITTPANFSLTISAISYALASFFFFLASRTTGTGIAMVIFFSFPLFVALYTFSQNGWRIDRITLLSLIAAPIGLFMLVDRNSHTANTQGIILALLAALSYAIYILISKKTLQKMGPLPFTLSVCLRSSCLFLVFALITQEASIPANLSTWGYLLALGIFATAIPIQLLLEGLKEISSLKASMASVLEPVVTLILGVLLLGESITLIQNAGIFLILGASILSQIASD